MCERCVRREKHTELPSGAGPGSACVHLTNEMSHGEDGASERSLQTNSPPALDRKERPAGMWERSCVLCQLTASLSGFISHPDVWLWGDQQAAR